MPHIVVRAHNVAHGSCFILLRDKAKMATVYSLTSRLNNICFFAAIVLGLMSAGNFLSAYYCTPRSATATFKLQGFSHLYRALAYHTPPYSIKDKYHRTEEALLTFDLNANLTRLFDWNTHIVFMWVSVAYSSPSSVSSLMHRDNNRRETR